MSFLAKYELWPVAASDLMGLAYRDKDKEGTNMLCSAPASSLGRGPGLCGEIALGWNSFLSPCRLGDCGCLASCPSHRVPLGREGHNGGGLQLDLEAQAKYRVHTLCSNSGFFLLQWLQPGPQLPLVRAKVSRQPPWHCP